MSLVSIGFDAHTQNAGHTPVPVDVYNEQLERVAQTVVELGSTQTVELGADGLYYVRATLPSGDTADATVRIERASAPTSVLLEAQERSPRETLAWAYAKHSIRRASGLAAPASGAVGLESGADLSRQAQLELHGQFRIAPQTARWVMEPVQLRIEEDRAVAFGDLRLVKQAIVSRNETGSPEDWYPVYLRWSIETGAAQRRTGLVALPLGSYATVLFVHADEATGSPVRCLVDATPPGTEALLAYMHQGMPSAARRIGDDVVQQAVAMLEDKRDNPYAACVAGYFLLRIGQLKQQAWMQNLADWFPAIPDGAIIYAASMLRRKNTKQHRQTAARYLVKAVERGVPVYTVGLRILFDSLRMLEGKDGGAAGVSAALKRIRPIAAFADWEAQTTSFLVPPGDGTLPIELAEPPSPRPPAPVGQGKDRTMDFDHTIVAAAARRWRERTDKRSATTDSIEAGIIADTLERVGRRLERLNTQVADHAAARVAPPAAIVPSIQLGTLGHERVVGRPDFLHFNFLALAGAVGRFVGRVHIREQPGRANGFGTGFMVSPRLLLTNNHVLPSKSVARNSEIEFDFEQQWNGRTPGGVFFKLEPNTFFLTDQALDYTLVAVAESSENNIALKRYGWSRLIEAEGKALLGDALNIIQHPQGQAKQIAIRSNQLVDLLDDFAHYATDTDPGSSGSPVYNDQWEVVALHHSGVPRSDANGNLLAKDGTIWHDGMDPASIDWVANEGIRISRLVRHIRSQQLDPAQSVLRDELLNLEPPRPFDVQAEALGAVEADARPSGAAPITAVGDAVSWTIPLQVTVQLNAPQAHTARYSAPVASTNGAVAGVPGAPAADTVG